MTSTITVKGQTVVPKALREQFGMEPGSILDWQAEGETLRVVKLSPVENSGFLKALRRLGRVPAVARDLRPVEKA